MTTIFVRHLVEDFDAWKPGYDEHGATRREYGLSDTGVFRDLDDANNVTLTFSAQDAGRAQEFLDSDDLRETMGKLGVISAPDVWVTNEG